MKPQKYKLKNGEDRWLFQIFIGRNPITGKQIKKTRMGFKSPIEATIAYAKMLEERQNGAYTLESLAVERVTIETLYHQWHEEYAQSVEASTLSKTESYYNNHILPDIGARKVREITSGELQSLLNKWATQAKSGVVWGQYLKQLFSYAQLHEIIFKNPFDVVTRPKQVNTSRERKQENFLNSEQLTRFLNYWETKTVPQYAYFRLLAYTGLRRGEILALTWDDFDFDRKLLTVNKSIGLDYRNKTTNMYLKQTKTGASNRVISIDNKTLEIMNAYHLIASKSMSNVVWPGKHTYMDFNVPERWIQKMRKELPDSDNDLKYVTLHGLRHTHATLLFEQAARHGKSAPIKAVQKRLGHADVAMTLQIYTHATNRENDIVNDILNDGFD